MIFVKADELKKGMRLAKPIYNKNGVMLYERDSRLTEQGIISIQNFGLIGIYVLEPAEPVPPMSAEDIELLCSAAFLQQSWTSFPRTGRRFLRCAVNCLLKTERPMRLWRWMTSRPPSKIAAMW